MHPFSLLTHPILFLIKQYTTWCWCLLCCWILLLKCHHSFNNQKWWIHQKMVGLSWEIPSINGWLVGPVGGFSPPLWKMMDFVSQLGWWNSIPNCFWKVIKFHGSSHHQMIFLASCSSNFRGKAPKHQPTAIATAQRPAAFRRSSASCASSRPRSWPKKVEVSPNSWEFHGNRRTDSMVMKLLWHIYI